MVVVADARPGCSVVVALCAAWVISLRRVVITGWSARCGGMSRVVVRSPRRARVVGGSHAGWGEVAVWAVVSRDIVGP